MTHVDAPAHSPLGASGRSRWANCPGSVRMSRGLPDHSNEYAQEGTLAHELAAQWLHDGACPEDLEERPEMREHLKVYIEAVGETLEAAGPGARLDVETRVSLAELHPDAFGTLDASVYSPSQHKLTVFDLKYGAGVVVEADANPQLQYYAVGALLDPAMDLRCTEVELVIVQPRAFHEDGHVRRYRMETIDLLDVIADLAAEMKRASEPDAPLVPGSWCRWCKAAAVCPAVQETALAVAQQEFAIVPGPSQPYDPAKLGELLAHLAKFDGWIEAVRGFAYAEAERGVSIPGWKLVPKRAVRKWANELEAATALPKILGINDCYAEPKLKSPAQIEKLLKKDQKPLLAGLVVSESSGTTLVPDTDKRQPAVPGSEFDIVVELP